MRSRPLNLRRLTQTWEKARTSPAPLLPDFSAARIGFLLSIFCIVSTGAICAQDLYIIERDGHYGFANRSGTPVIPPAFDSAAPFSEGLAAACSKRRWGYINKTGEYAIPPIFERAMSFSEGLAAVRSNGPWGYINKTGEYAIAPAFSAAEPFSEGLAAVAAGFGAVLGVRTDKGWGYINKNDEIRIAPNFPFFADGFVGGLAVVSDPVRGTQIYIDSAGKSQFLMSSKRRSNNLAYAVAPLSRYVFIGPSF
jgi:hypothetical protein